MMLTDQNKNICLSAMMQKQNVSIPCQQELWHNIQTAITIERNSIVEKYCIILLIDLNPKYLSLLK